MGILREGGTPKPAAQVFAQHSDLLGVCQWFHFEDHRLQEAVSWLRRLRVRHLRTGLSWADSYRPNALHWLDRQMAALKEFDTTVTVCFTPEHRRIVPHHTSASIDPSEFADFCGSMVHRYAPVTLPA
jgi:beta-xylosidase